MTLLLALSAFPLALADEEAPRFTDVPAGAYYEEAVKWCAEKGITSGKTAEIFAPDETCTRAQIVTFLYRAAGAPVPTSEITFTDAAPDAYYYDALRWAVEQGITNGLLPNRFCPDVPCSRGEVAVFLHRAAGEPAAAHPCPFGDVPAWCRSAVAWCTEQGIANGFFPERFYASATVKRAQVAAFLWRASLSQNG